MDTSHAVILTAGEGKRLLPLTKKTPKCLLEVNEKPILEYALAALSENGIKRIRVVVGHLAHVIRNTVPLRFPHLDIEFIENSRYQSTNSMYSLYLGLKGLDEPTWMLEGDVIFEPRIMQSAVTRNISWFVDSAKKDQDGAYLRTDQSRRALSLQIIRDLPVADDALCKSIGILHLDSIGVSNFHDWLQLAVRRRQTDLYYDLILADHFTDTFVEIVDVSPAKWIEVDSPVDLESAKKCFS